MKTGIFLACFKIVQESDLAQHFKKNFTLRFLLFKITLHLVLHDGHIKIYSHYSK